MRKQEAKRRFRQSSIVAARDIKKAFHAWGGQIRKTKSSAYMLGPTFTLVAHLHWGLARGAGALLLFVYRYIRAS